MTQPRYLDIFLTCPADLQEILSAELFEIGFEGIWQQDEGLHAYIPLNDFDQEALSDLLNRYELDTKELQITNMDQVNWNEDWEKAYDPILVDNRCMIRAEFHEPVEGLEYDIIIQPKMSFGTGHHDSTRLIVEMMLNMDFTGKSVIDVGCGTGVLAILAGMKGADPIVAIDNNPWSYENTLENAERNHIPMEVIESDIESFKGSGYEIILSNITRNINHQNIPKYAGMVQTGGSLIMSGFFNHDFDFLNDQAIKHGFRLLNKLVSEKNWIALHYTK
ncbi:MAG: 50S ribosomal protein L11 methyltransferase [Bacteroidota bacterium]|nr:50S ribosomal protein L11 methyltransferase [Bacteroidota bacterium]MDX5430202.1 50S ribosomal protein L11 methyltransferase [Bacteroidota bacterium]MDX5468964.1 50S ribosomal protein L11 methyltransferase [Bacteroidota bacterium]